MSRKPKIEHGHAFDGGRIARVTFDLTSPDVKEQIGKFFRDHPEITIGEEPDSRTEQ